MPDPREEPREPTIYEAKVELPDLTPDRAYDDDELVGVRSAMWAYPPGSVPRRLLATVDDLKTQCTALRKMIR